MCVCADVCVFRGRNLTAETKGVFVAVVLLLASLERAAVTVSLWEVPHKNRHANGNCLTSL